MNKQNPLIGFQENPLRQKSVKIVSCWPSFGLCGSHPTELFCVLPYPLYIDLNMIINAQDFPLATDRSMLQY